MNDKNVVAKHGYRDVAKFKRRVIDKKDKNTLFTNAWRASAQTRGSKRQFDSSVENEKKKIEGKDLRIRIKSVGCFDPPFYGTHCSDTSGSINVNGIEMSKNQPGFNFVIIDMETGGLENSVNFDTGGEAGVDEKMIDFINGLPLWKIVCVAIKDDAKTYLSDSAIEVFAKIGATQLINQKLETRASYSFVGLSGPVNARNKVTWIREESNRAGNGPSVISIIVESGQSIVQSLKEKLHMSKSNSSPSPISRPSQIDLASTQTQLLDSQQKDIQILKSKEQTFANQIDTEASHIEEIPVTTTETTTIALTTTPSISTTLLTSIAPSTTSTPSTSNLPSISTTIAQPQSQSQLQNIGSSIKQVIPNNLIENNIIYATWLNTIRNRLINLSNKDLNTAITKDIVNPTTSTNILPSVDSEYLNTLQSIDLENLISNPGNPTASLLNALKSLNNQNNDITANKKSKQNEKPMIDQSQFLQTMLDNVNQLKAQLQLHLMSNAASNLSITSPSTSNKIAESRTVPVAEEKVLPSEDDEDSETRSKGAPSTMEAAADAAGSRNVGESRLASALSSLGIPDAAATGIASLIAAGFVAAGANKKKEAALKLGLAAKLAKSIADLGGRGAASAAGIASLSELLKDSRDMSTTRIADQLGQALQRIGGAGAAVGYASLAASLKAVGDKPKPGALIGGIILALAEQGSAPGTAGLAAFAAGLGGSGADALAGGLGGSLPNIITAARTNNFMSGEEGHHEEGHHEEGGHHDIHYDDPNAALVGGGNLNQFHHSDNTDAEYTGYGPIGSHSQHAHHGHFEEGGICRGLNCQQRGNSLQKPQQDISSISRSTTENEGYLLPTLIGGGELVRTDAGQENQCYMKKNVPQKCNRLCNEKSNLLGRIVDAQSSDKKASIKVNGEEYSKDEDGFNMVVIDLNSGQIEASEVFDTTQDAGAAKTLVNFIHSLGDKKIIVGATKGTVERYMFNEVYKTLDELGLKKMPRNSPFNGATKYVFLASKDNSLQGVKEDLNDDIAELISPLVTDSKENLCKCLVKCMESTISGDSEKAYADLGDNIAGRVGTKRHLHQVVVPQKHRPPVVKVTSSGKENLSHRKLNGEPEMDGSENSKPQAISLLNNNFKALQNKFQEKENRENIQKEQQDSKSTGRKPSDSIYSTIGNNVRQW